MKKKTFMFYAVLTILLTACSSNIEETDVIPVSANDSEELEFENLCSDIDAIGFKYNSPITRVDLNKWGGRIFSATVDGITGYIAGPAGWAVGPLCSWAFDEHWENCTNQMRAASRRIDSYSSYTYVFDDGTMAKSDSIGYYHNMILYDLAKSGKDYITIDEEIDYQAILDDCISVARKYGIYLNISSADRQKYVSFSRDAVRSFADCYQQKITIEEAYNNISASYANKFNEKLYFDKVEIVQRKIADILNNIDNESSIKEYADQVNVVLRDANVNPKLKNDLKTVTDITVNSKLYWSTAQR